MPEAREVKAVPGPHLVCGFLTTAPNTVVGPIHPKAMPVILTTQEEWSMWLSGSDFDLVPKPTDHGRR
jgi:putative SOS response-associated peptidase YedK